MRNVQEAVLLLSAMSMVAAETLPEVPSPLDELSKIADPAENKRHQQNLQRMRALAEERKRKRDEIAQWNAEVEKRKQARKQRRAEKRIAVK